MRFFRKVEKPSSPFVISQYSKIAILSNFFLGSRSIVSDATVSALAHRVSIPPSTVFFRPVAFDYGCSLHRTGSRDNLALLRQRLVSFQSETLTQSYHLLRLMVADASGSVRRNIHYERIAVVGAPIEELLKFVEISDRTVVGFLDHVHALLRQIVCSKGI